MHNIVICGDVGERRLTETIINVCSKNGGVLVCDGEKLYETSQNPRFFIATDIKKIDTKSIVVLGEDVGDIQIRNEFAINVEGENMRGLEILKNQGCKNVLTCSMNGKATLNISSVYPQKIINLQRNIKTLDGKMTEPCEFKISCEEDEIYPVLAAGGIMVPSGLND